MLSFPVISFREVVFTALYVTRKLVVLFSGSSLAFVPYSITQQLRGIAPHTTQEGPLHVCGHRACKEGVDFLWSTQKICPVLVRGVLEGEPGELSTRWKNIRVV